MKIVICNTAFHTNTPTGGDTIFVECAKRWVRAGHVVTIFTTESCAAYCQSHGFPKESIRIWPFAVFDTLGYEAAIIIKTVLATLYAVLTPNISADIYFASSFFLPDSIPAYIMYRRSKSNVFLTSMYVYTKRYFGGGYSGGAIKGFFFWIHEAIVVQLLKWSKGFVLMSSTYDAAELIRLTNLPPSRVHGVDGGVDVDFFTSIPPQGHVYTAVFVGRFKPQKCIPELLHIWKMVHDHDHTRTLAIIGGGPEKEALRHLVKILGLADSVHFLGVLDGEQKTRVLKSSRVFVSSSRFDTGNIALDEALACKVPGVIYDLPSMHYELGVIRVPVGDTDGFVHAIEQVLGNSALRAKLQTDALRFARSIDWNIRSEQILKFASSTTR